MTKKITDEIADEILATLGRTHYVTNTDRTDRTITVHHMGQIKAGVSREEYDASEAVLTDKFCGWDHLMASDHTNYRFALACN